MKWIKLDKENLPNINQWCLFSQWTQLESIDSKYPPLSIVSYFGTVHDAVLWRKYDLENSYTHYIKVEPPKE